MMIRLSKDQQFVDGLVNGGHYASHDEVIDRALASLRLKEVAEQARVIDGIRRGIEEMNSGSGRPADDVFADMAREFKIPPDA